MRESVRTNRNVVGGINGEVQCPPKRRSYTNPSRGMGINENIRQWEELQHHLSPEEREGTEKKKP